MRWLSHRNVAHVVLTALTVGGVSIAAGQTPGPPMPPVALGSLAGRDSFESYCASCHGRGGAGDGPTAAALRSRPADLTALARRNDGSYPRDRVRELITGTGRAVAAHGPTEMPVWGPLFRAFEQDALARERIENLVAYVESLQLPSSGPGTQGSQLFRTHCASCHGTGARGDGPLAAALRRPPPDLTQFTRRNGGMFPRERVHRIIDGRDVPSHGDREMPVWGDVFRQAADAAATKARIDALVAYLEAIQARDAE